MALRITPLGALIMGGLMALPQVEVSAASRELEADDGWARASAPGQAVTAGYLELRNRSAAPDAVVAASSPIAASVELHSTRIEKGVMRMRRIERLELAAGGSVRLAPGGSHLMLKGLRRPLSPGQTVPITLRLASGRSLSATLVVRNGNSHQQEDHRHHGHD